MAKAEKPTAAFILSLIGGIFVLLGGILVMVRRTILIGGLSGVYRIIGIVWGILIIISAIMLNAQPAQHMTWGILVLVFSFLSWFGARGGIIVGFILGLIGGILGIIWKLPVMQTTPAQPTITRICPNCGTVIGTDLKFCPHCGKELP